jgi:hypothetical protein
LGERQDIFGGVAGSLDLVDYRIIELFCMFPKILKASPKEGDERLALFSGRFSSPINRDVCEEASYRLIKPIYTILKQ